MRSAWKITPLLWLVAFHAQGVDEHLVRPGEDVQAVVDRAAPGDRVVLLAGLHVQPLGKHQSMLYLDKPLDIELAEGSILKLADNQTVLLDDPEITTDHSAKTIDDLEVGGKYDRSRGPMLLTITIDGEGAEGSADTFRWAPGVFGKSTAERIPITGQWQPLAHGIEVRFQATRGHNKNAFWFVSYDGRESYGIRIGHGTQKETIENVRIGGQGTIDLNSANNVQPSGMVKNISACVLVHGRVRNVLVEDITMTNTMRSVMIYGEHTGKFLPGGGVGEGESFDAQAIEIVGTRTINPGGAAYLLGHPSHRGQLSDVKCNFNIMQSMTTSLEPNFNLDRYEVIGNLIESDGLAVHCWRRSTHGTLLHNARIHDTSKRPVVVNNAPGGWRTSEHLVIEGNSNLTSDDLPSSLEAVSSLPAGHCVLRGTTNGDEFQTLTLDVGAPCIVSASGATQVRLVALARSDDGKSRAAFQATAQVGMATAGAELNDLRIIPGCRTSENIDLELALDESTESAGNRSVAVRVRGEKGVKLRWLCHIQIEPRGDRPGN